MKSWNKCVFLFHMYFGSLGEEGFDYDIDFATIRATFINAYLEKGVNKSGFLKLTVDLKCSRYLYMNCFATDQK